MDRAWGDPPRPTRRSPVGQLVKSLISSRTRDEESLAAFRTLRARFGSARGIAAATPADVEAALAGVTFADVKAGRLVEALGAIAAERPDMSLGFLADLPVADALAWLERLPGVGRKTAAAVLNFTALDRPVFAADTHVARSLGRLGLAEGRGTADAGAVSERVTAAMEEWSADDFRVFHVQCKRLGKTICRHTAPNCRRCPLADDCDYAARAGIAPR